MGMSALSNVSKLVHLLEQDGAMENYQILGSLGNALRFYLRKYFKLRTFDDIISEKRLAEVNCFEDM